MPSKSKAQQKFMGMVHALQKGDMKPSDASASVKKAAQSMSDKDAKDFASTSHKGLPKKVKQEILNKLKEYANKMGRDHLGGDDYTSKRKGGLRDFDGYDNVDYNKDMPMDESVDYKYLTQTLLDAKPKHNVYYNSGHNKVNIGGVGYDGGDLVKNFNQKSGSSSKIKNNFYHADQDPQQTKKEVEKLSKGKIKVDIQKGYGGKLVPVYIVKESVNEGFKSEYKGNDGIIWKKGKTRGGVTNFTPYYKGHDIDKGGHNFKTEKELKDFIKDYILSNQLYNKYRFESVNEGPIDRVIGGRPYNYVGDGRRGKAIVPGPMKDRERNDILKRAKKAGYSAAPGIKGGVVIYVESIYEGMFSTIDQIRQDSKDVRDFVKKVFADRDFKDMKNDKEFLKYLKSIYEGVDESKGVPQNYMQGRTSDYHTALRGKNKDYSGGTNFKKTNHGQPDLENDEEDQETNQLSNKQIALKAESFDKVEHLKLLNLALRTMPGSQKQKEIIRKLNQVRKAGGMRPLKETSIIEYGQRLDLSFIEDEDARLDGTPEPKDAINRDLDEGTMIRMAGQIAQELLPKDTWSRYSSDGKKNKEFVKSVVKDLAQILNRFYKSHNINLRIKESKNKE
jgi:hypothetical protein